MSLQANTTDAVSVYVVNQGILKETLTLNPSNGLLAFEDVGYTITGKGRFLFVFESQEVLSENAYNDPLKYDSFVCYPVNGVGDTAEDAVYSENANSNGLNFNITTYLDSDIYVTNNKTNFASFLKCQFEYDFIRMALHNSNVRSNADERILAGDENAMRLLATESLNLDMLTVAKKYKDEKKIAIESINKTFDRYLTKPTGLTVKRKTIRQ